MPNPLLPLPPDCIRLPFLRRLKRFSIEAGEEGRSVWAHTNNTGAMLGLLRRGAPLLLSPVLKKGRKLPYTLERVWLGGEDGFWAGLNTSHPEKILEAAFHAGKLPFAKGYRHFRAEARCGESRLDACFSAPDLPVLWVECKNVTLVEDCVAAFPDAASARARKHLHELMGIAARGERAAMFYLVQRPDARCFAPADYIDGEYADLFYRALAAGVEMYAFQALMRGDGTDLGPRLPLKGADLTEA